MLNGYVEDIKGFANQMEDLMSILSQASSPVGPHYAAIQPTRCCSFKAAAEKSFVRTCDAPNLPQPNGPLMMQRRPNYPGYINNDFLPSSGWQPQPHCSFNYPCENNQYVFNTAPWSQRLPETRNNCDKFGQFRQPAPEEKNVRPPFVQYPPECFTDDDLDGFQHGIRNQQYNHLEELTMMTEFSFCTQTVLPETPSQQRHFPEHLGRRTPTYKQDTYARDSSNDEKARQRKDDGLWGGAPSKSREFRKMNPNQSH